MINVPGGVSVLEHTVPAHTYLGPHHQGEATLLPHVCRVVTVDRDDLPQGHEFIIVRHHGEPDDDVIFASADPRAQLEARVAYLAWDRLHPNERAPAPARL